MTESESRRQEKVFIIESPSPRDILDGRVEGEALSSALRLAEIPTYYYRTCNLETFDAAFAEKIPFCALSETKLLEGREVQKTHCVPFIHVSAHGNKSGLGLTSGEFVSWNHLRTLLVNLAEAIGITRNGKSLLQVCFSTCMGAHAQEMLLHGKPYPCYAIIGPATSVAWSDSLTAFTTFYHQLISKQNLAVEATRIMNEAAGLRDIFKCIRIPEEDDR